MLHPSYTDLMKLVNSEVETGEAPVVNSRYSIVLATSKRARQIIDGAESYVSPKCPKPLSIAIDELNNSKIRILSEEEAAEVEARKAAEAERAAEDVPVQTEEDTSEADEEVLEIAGEAAAIETAPEADNAAEDMADTITATAEEAAGSGLADVVED
ncbi:MAG: DNA-directed RNA polymerase subunit omega [Lachnospiraceae bacterium]|nr:DNA-directed RNA polymerase subunit omega [Lachnospiraceae bacterium]